MKTQTLFFVLITAKRRNLVTFYFIVQIETIKSSQHFCPFVNTTVEPRVKCSVYRVISKQKMTLNLTSTPEII